MARTTSRKPQLSIIIPVYNEEQTIITLLQQVQNAPIQESISSEVIVVDDGSWDKTRDLLKKHPKLYTQLILKKENEGKGSAIHAGIAAARGEIVLIQDADLEYDPAEYGGLIAPILANKADVVFGSRFVGSKAHRVVYFWHYVANKALTLFSNMTTNLNLTDMESCYKAFRKTVLDRVILQEKGFGFEPEVTAQIARLGVRVYEVGISYNGRTYQEGKKIGFWDAVRAIWVIMRQLFR